MIKPGKVLALVLSSVLALCAAGCGSKDASTGDSAAQADSASDTSAVSGSSSVPDGGVNPMLPYDLEDGRIQVTSVFTSDIDNPDCGDEYMESAASIEVVNNAGTCLVSGDFGMTMEDGTKVDFHIDYLPAGETAWLFASDNTALENTDFSEITCDCTFAEDDVMMADCIAVSSDGINVSLTNNSDETIADLTVYCHCTIDGVLYGGTVYTYPVASAAPGETVSVAAEECMLGTAEAVSVQQNT